MHADLNQQRLRWLGWLFHAGGLVTLVLGALGYHFLISGMITHQRQQNASEIRRLENLLATAGDVRREHERLSARLADLEQRAETIRQRIPDQPHEGTFLKQVTEVAKHRGLTIHNYTRGNVTTTDTHSQLEIRLTGEGDYKSICGFFDAIASLPRVARIRRMTMSTRRGETSYPLDLTLLLYFGAKAAETGETRG